MATDTLVRIGALIIDGLSLGLLYAMLGLGITLVFGLGGILNLALGAFMIIAITDQTNNLAFVDTKIDVVDRGQSAEPFGNAANR